MKNYILLPCLLLTGCAQVISSNDKQITISAPPVAAAEAQQKADMHCANFNKVAIPSSTIYGNHVVYRCE